MDRDVDYALLLFHDNEAELLAVGSHRAEQIMLSSGEVVKAARLVVFALAVAYQGRRIGGKPLSDIAFTHLIRAAARAHQAELVTAAVARDNARSLTVCERNGLTSQTLMSRRLVRLTGRFKLQVRARRG